jgi:uncharacterized FlaG/YvyC family protein
MYSVEFRIVPSSPELTTAQHTEIVQKTKKVANALDAPHQEPEPVPVVKDVIGEKARREQLQRILNQITGAGRYIRFDRYEKTGELIIRVCDCETDEVVKEIPPEKILDVVNGLCELAGLLVDEIA